MSLYSFISRRKQTSNHGSSGRDAVYFERTSNHPRPVVHQVKAHTFCAGSRIANSIAIILNGKRPLMLEYGEANGDLACVAVLDRVVHRLPGNIVKMRRHGIVVDQHWSKAMEAATHCEQVFHFPRPL